MLIKILGRKLLKGASYSLPFCFLACAPGAGGDRQLQFSRIDGELKSLREIQAEQTSEVASIRSDLRELLGKVDEIEFYQKEVVKRDLETVKRDATALRQRVPPPQNVPAKELDEDQNITSSISASAGARVSAGLLAIRIGDFRGGVEQLQRAAEEANGEDWAGTVLFWIGVAFEGLSQPRDALASYNELATLFPKHIRTPLALLRQADVFLKLGDKRAGKLTLQKLASLFPKSAEGNVARRRLREL